MKELSCASLGFAVDIPSIVEGSSASTGNFFYFINFANDVTTDNLDPKKNTIPYRKIQVY